MLQRKEIWIWLKKVFVFLCFSDARYDKDDDKPVEPKDTQSQSFKLNCSKTKLCVLNCTLWPFLSSEKSVSSLSKT